MSTISKSNFKTHIEGFDFTNLFNHLGWNYIDEQFSVKIKNEIYSFYSVAEKSGYRIIVYYSSATQNMPDYVTRLQLDKKITHLYREHLIIFCDKNKSMQIWQLFFKQLGKPTRLSETRWFKGQEPELLYQKTSSLFFSLDDEENVTITDVVEIVTENFGRNIEQVTKKFYDNFRKVHKLFLEFIKGIEIVSDKEWYASLMLNRLMFCYFIQKKGFLDNNQNYLKEKLLLCQNKKGKDKFYVSFYKNFLMALFHQGLGAPIHSAEFKSDLGRIPYLNGGLFDVHELEKQYQNINISDDAFIKVFNFFDEYNWHLDTRIIASGKDINPDVIGFIFEKYINDRAQMGAYYTKEDITDYISKNCIIPYFFDQIKQHYPELLNPNGEVWSQFKHSNDNYIYDNIKHGVSNPIPLEISDGIINISKRDEWNKQAPIDFALPSETWREVIDRRNRYIDLNRKISSGEISDINDFITYNLNIRQFAQDLIDNTSDPKFLETFYKSLTSITVIDPTCGSGAFLFAAMNILEPLYESCIQRMENFVAEAPIGKYKFFENTLKSINSDEHPNLKYFIFKSIILRNLYGVDIMKEAVEIAKLRLFLKLVSTVDADFTAKGIHNNLGLEPLPDIDFNIRSGNSLVGFASENEISKAFYGTIDFDNSTEIIKSKCEQVANSFQQYKEIQLKSGENYNEVKQAKSELSIKLKSLNSELNQLIYKKPNVLKYNDWLSRYQPFHWFAEFYEIINDKGGFDVIIGNPPYVEYSKVRDTYKIADYYTEKCGNLYAYIFERSFTLSKNTIGLIIQLSAIGTETMKPLQDYIQKSASTIFSSCFPERPKQLFDGACIALTIQICQKNGNVKSFFSGGINRTTESARDTLFDKMSYVSINDEFLPNQSLFPKFKDEIEKSIFQKIIKEKPISSYILKAYNPNNSIYYRTAGGRYWKIFLSRDFANISTSNKYKSFDSKYDKNVIVAILNSNLFWWFFANFFDLYNLKDYMIFSFPFNFNSEEEELKSQGIRLMNSFEKNVETKEQYIQSKSQTSYFETFNPAYSKNIIDDIDRLLANHYGFNENELEFIINYDIKYRMGIIDDIEEF